MLERAESAWTVLAPRLRPLAPWVVYVATALCCTAYLNARADLIPKWGQWYGADDQPFVLLQVRSFLSGKLALVPHPGGANIDAFWGRGGMHISWGLGVSILATPLHLLGRLFGAPGFPDSARFLIFYAMTAVVLARALHSVSGNEPGALVTSAAAAGFVMVFPTYVGMVSSRFLIYEQTIATGALWSVLLLSGVLLLLHKCTPARLLAVCAAAGFAGVIRIPLTLYGPTTTLLALVIARRKAALEVAGRRLGRLRGLRVALLRGEHSPVRRAAQFRIRKLPLSLVSQPDDPVEFAVGQGALHGRCEGDVRHAVSPPAGRVRDLLAAAGNGSLRREGEFGEYYAPTFDKVVLAIWVGALVIVCFRVVRGRLWRRDRDL